MTAVATEVADQIVALRVELAETLDGLKDEEAGWQPGRRVSGAFSKSSPISWGGRGPVE